MVLAANGWWLWSILALVVWIAIAFWPGTGGRQKGPQLLRLLRL